MSLNNPAQFLENKIKETPNPNIKDKNLLKHLKTLSNKIESHKAVYVCLIMLLVKKIDDPKQDIRYHKVELDNGFSGRTYDTKFITPVLKRNQLPSMAESAYLTRSIEQPHPLNKNFPGKVRDEYVKKSFLEIIDIFQKEPSHCENILNYLIKEGKKIKDKNFVPVKKIKTKEKIFINDLIKLLMSYLNTHYGVSGISKVPVICIYTIYQIFFKEIDRFKKFTLKEMGFHTTSDRTSRSAGDIEIFDKDNLVEGFEIKFNKEIDEHLLEIVYEKIKKFNPQRYHIIHTISLSEKNINKLNKKIEEIKDEHGCQIIIDNFFTCLSSYLRLIDNIEDFINLLSKNITKDKELKLIHKKKWKQLIEKKYGK